jgi:hypothetical protein
MITGFNTDVQHGGRVYHVQTEDRGHEHPFFESLVYVGGTIVAKKRTPYGEQIDQGATEEAIAQLLRRQHQVVIAAIKAGRIDDLIRHTAEESKVSDLDRQVLNVPSDKSGASAAQVPEDTVAAPPAPNRVASRRPAPSQAPPNQNQVAKNQPGQNPAGTSPPPEAGTPASPLTDTAQPVARAHGSRPLTAERQAPAAQQPGGKVTGTSGKIGLNLDQVISDYLKRSSEQGKLDLKVISPNVFIAGKSISLKVRVSRAETLEPEAIVTVKVIGTAFKPQVYMARADRHGVSTFNITLPPFSAGTAAIVIEAQSSRGRGELKHLIRRA